MSANAGPAAVEQQDFAGPLPSAFAGLSLSYGMVVQDAKYGELSPAVLDSFVNDCEELLALARSLRVQFQEVQS